MIPLRSSSSTPLPASKRRKTGERVEQVYHYVNCFKKVRMIRIGYDKSVTIIKATPAETFMSERLASLAGKTAPEG
jgi:hypothetical protein